MGKINYCPIIGGQCNKIESEILIKKDTFFLAEPFHPEQERNRRERAVKNTLREAIGDEFSEKMLRVADKEPKEPAIFCDICRQIQSSAYGIVDISGLNPNVLLELGMMFSLAKPVFVIVKRSEKEDLKEKLPSDIVWRRIITYEEFIDIEEELYQQIQNRPQVEPEPPLAEKAKKLIAEVDPSFAQAMDAKLQEIKREQEKRLKNLEKLLKEARLSETIVQEKKIEIPPYLEKQIDELDGKVERIEKLVGFPENPDIAFLRGNLHYQKKEYNRALELYDWALTIRPHLDAVWNNKGATLAKLGRHEEAIDSLDKAIGLKKNDDKGWYNKGNVLGNLGRYEEAINCFDKAIKIKKDNEEAWNNKGVALGKLGRWEEAKFCYEEVLKRNPNDISVLNNYSEALFILADLEKGLENAGKALCLADKLDDKCISWFLLISAYFFKRENERAKDEIKSFINYFRGFEKDFKVTEWDFSPLLSTVEERLRGKNKRKLLSLIYLLKGEIGLDEFEMRIKSS